MRLRITFSKNGALRYTGHLDLQTIWERTIRRARLLLMYTQGFHPGPKIQIASALPLGLIGRAEIVDIWINETDSHEELPYADVLQSAAPPGLIILRVEEVDEHSPALQTQVVAAEYEVTLLEAVDQLGLERKVVEMLEAVSLPRERRGKVYDLRPLIEECAIIASPISPSSLGRDGGNGTEMRIFLRLAAREGATGRPEEVLAVLGIPLEIARIERTRLILKNDIK